jgi:hypothetical protein
MESGKTGTCRFCGQQLIVHGSEDMTASQLEEAATMQCDCDDAKAYQETAQRRDKAKQRVKELFGEGAQNYRQPDVMLEAMFKAVDMICDKQAKQFVFTIRTGLKCRIMQMAKDKIKVVREVSSNESFEQ